MASYTKNTNFTAKDSLEVGDSNKIVRGSELDGEFDEIATVVNGKQDTITGLTATGAELNILDGATLSTTELNKLDGVAGDVVGTSDTQTLSGKTITNLILDGHFVEEVFTETVSSSTHTFDTANGTIQDVTLSTSITSLTLSLESGESLLLIINAGANTMTWPSLFWVGGSAPTLDTTNENIIALWKSGSNVFGSFIGVATSV